MVTHTRSIDVFDPFVFGSAVGSLRLLPVNALLQRDFDELLYRVLSGSGRGKQCTITDQDFSRLLSQCASMPLDPPLRSLVQPVYFIGGEYLLATDGETHLVEPAQKLLDALLMSHHIDHATKRYLFPRICAVLRLSAAVMERAGLQRYQSFVRDNCNFDLSPARLQTVQFTLSELEQMTNSDMDLWDDIVYDLDADHTFNQKYSDLIKPLWRCNDRFVLVNPNRLGFWLQKIILNYAARTSKSEFLQHALVEVSEGVLFQQLIDNLHWKYCGHAPFSMVKQNNSEQWISSSLHKSDTDQMIHILLVAPSLERQNLLLPGTYWEPEQTEIATRIKEAEDVLVFSPDPPNDLLHFIIYLEVGCSVVCPSFTNERTVFTEMAFSFEEVLLLTSISGKPLHTSTLSRYAKDRQKLQQQPLWLAPSSSLASLAVWLNHYESFYFDDSAIPSVLHFDETNAVALRAEIESKRDRHLVKTPAGKYERVVHFEFEEDIPIYHTAAEPILSYRIELPQSAAWVIGDVPASATDKEIDAYCLVVRAVVYWVWQINQHIKTSNQEIEIHISIPDTSPWLSPVQLPLPSTPTPVAIITNINERIKIDLQDTFAAYCGLDDNSAERLLVAELIPAIANAFNTSDNPSIEDVAPLGSKRMINFLDQTPPRTPLPPVHQPPSRGYYTGQVLDQVGNFLHHQDPHFLGIIKQQDRHQKINDAVEFAWKKLHVLTQSLAHNGVLECLVATYESAIYREETLHAKLGPEVSCFGETRSQKLFEQNEHHIILAQSLRFLIEIFTAEPPQGCRPFSSAVLDEMVAWASQIIYMGNVSELIYYEIADVEIEMLPSGRIAIDTKEDFIEIIREYQQALIDKQVYNAITASSVQPVQSIATSALHHQQQQRETAYKAEWGLSYSEMQTAFAALVDKGFVESASNGTAVAALPQSDLKLHLGQVSGLTSQQIDSFLDLLTLKDRGGFFPAPRKQKIFPWIFKRELSYLRKPLLERHNTQTSTTDIIWGPRHIYQAWDFLNQMIQGNRLPTNSKELRAYQQSSRQPYDKAFEHHVGEECRNSGLEVYETIQKSSAPAGWNFPQALGDIDVLALDRTSKKLVAIECKNFELARTPREISDDLRDTFSHAQPGNHPTHIDRHEGRVAWLNTNLEQVLNTYGIGNAQDWEVIGVFVTSVSLISALVAKHLPFSIIAFSDLEQGLRNDNLQWHH